MKTYHLTFRATDKINFDTIKDGRKPIETRAATVKYKDMRSGDVLAISCAGETVEKEIKQVRHFASIDEMFAEVPLHSVMPLAETIEDAKKEYYSYPGYREKIAEHGLVALYL